MIRLAAALLAVTLCGGCILLVDPDQGCHADADCPADFACEPSKRVCLAKKVGAGSIGGSASGSSSSGSTLTSSSTSTSGSLASSTSGSGSASSSGSSGTTVSASSSSSSSTTTGATSGSGSSGGSSGSTGGIVCGTATCDAPGECQLPASSCNPADGGCLYPTAPDNTLCNSRDYCVSGTCTTCPTGDCISVTAPCNFATWSCQGGNGPECVVDTAAFKPDDFVCSSDGKSRCCNSACVDSTSDAQHCGSCGTSCTAPSTCHSSGCTSFFGVYARADDCGFASPVCETTSADAGRPCDSCPAGISSTASHDASILTDYQSYSHPLSDLGSCNGPAPTDYGGMYSQNTCGGAATCPFGNAFAAGNCACPAGTNWSTLVMPIVHFCGSNGGSSSPFTCNQLEALDDLVICYDPAVPQSSFGGAYLLDDNVTGGAGCHVPNPETNGCSCPSVATQSVRVYTYGSTQQVYGATLVFCGPP